MPYHLATTPYEDSVGLAVFFVTSNHTNILALFFQDFFIF